jgi:hypothetical protein
VADVEYWTHGQGEEVAVMGKALAVACSLAGVLFGCVASFLLFVWFVRLIDGAQWGLLVWGVGCVPASIVSFLLARRLWRIDEE